MVMESALGMLEGIVDEFFDDAVNRQVQGSWKNRILLQAGFKTDTDIWDLSD